MILWILNVPLYMDLQVKRQGSHYSMYIVIHFAKTEEAIWNWEMMMKFAEHKNKNLGKLNTLNRNFFLSMRFIPTVGESSCTSQVVWEWFGHQIWKYSSIMISISTE